MDRYGTEKHECFSTSVGYIAAATAIILDAGNYGQKEKDTAVVVVVATLEGQE